MPLAERNKMSLKERFRWLEKYGKVPEDADYGSIDWVLAQKTSWWGKRLDPREFWKDRVVWLDEAAQKAARSHGRFYPPIPCEYTWSKNYAADEGINWGSFELEGPNIHYATSSAEGGFWDMFYKTNPTPPSDLIREQANVASSIMATRYYFEKGGNPGRDTLKTIAEHERIQRQRATQMGYPPESLTDEALYWAYVLNMRKKYEKAPFLPSSLAVDVKLINDPLTTDQLKAANAWKFAYLRRLHRENVDRQYIQAYIKAWSLSEEEVFANRD